MFVFISNEKDDTTTMCISREKLVQLLKQYPNVHEHWVTMAKLRRREFRRLALKAQQVLDLKVEDKPELLDLVEMEMQQKPIQGRKFKDLRNYLPHLPESDDEDEDLDAENEFESNVVKNKSKSNSKRVNKGIDKILNFGFNQYGDTLENLKGRLRSNISKIESSMQSKAPAELEKLQEIADEL